MDERQRTHFIGDDCPGGHHQDWCHLIGHGECCGAECDCVPSSFGTPVPPEHLR